MQKWLQEMEVKQTCAALDGGTIVAEPRFALLQLYRQAKEIKRKLDNVTWIGALKERD